MSVHSSSGDFKTSNSAFSEHVLHKVVPRSSGLYEEEWCYGLLVNLNHRGNSLVQAADKNCHSDLKYKSLKRKY